MVIWCRGGVRQQSAVTVLVTTFALHGWSSGSVAGCPAVFPGGHSRCLFRVLADLREPKISQLSRALFWPVGLTKKNKSSGAKMGGNAQFDRCRCHPGAGTGIDAPPQCPHADQLSRWPHQHRRAGPSATPPMARSRCNLLYGAPPLSVVSSEQLRLQPTSFAYHPPEQVIAEEIVEHVEPPFGSITGLPMTPEMRVETAAQVKS